MPNWVGPYAGVIAVSVLIWGIGSIAAGELLYFWPVWMLIPLIFGVIGQMTGRRSGATAAVIAGRLARLAHWDAWAVTR